MEKLTAAQSELGNKLEQLLINFKKDSASRKTKEYLDKRLGLSEGYWSEFNQIHEQLKPFEVTAPDHPYFENKYHDEIWKVYEKLRHLLNNARRRLQGTSFNDNTMASSPAGKSGATSAVRTPEHHGDFKLMGDNDEARDVLARMIRKQKALMRTLTYFIQDIEQKASSDHSNEYYALKVNVLKRYVDELAENDQAIWEQTTESSPFDYKPELCQELHCWTQETIISLQERMRSAEGGIGNLRPQSGDTAVQLPKIVLPTFDGDYLQWTQFRDMYLQLIHNRAIGNAQKLYYLLSNLTGEAKRLIQHLPVSSDNYSDAWNMLKERFDNKRLLVTHLLNKLLSQPLSSVESASSVKNLHDTTNECLLGLKNLGITIDAWDPILLHLLVKRLDHTTHTLYEQSLAEPRQLSTVKHFLSFLENRFQSLEALGKGGSAPTKQKQTKPASLVTSSKGSTCIVCKETHPLYFCKTFLNKLPRARLQIVKKNNLCYNCLKADHNSQMCALRGCKKCSQRHNTLLHIDSVSKGEAISNNQDAKSSSTALQAPAGTSTMPSNSTTLAAKTNNTRRSNILLSTVLIKVIANDGQEHECRAVLDSRSQLNFITDELVRRLGLMEVPEALCVQGIGQGIQKTQSRVNFSIRSRTTGFSARIEAFVLPQITSYQPSEFVDIASWPIPQNVSLADLGFNHPSQIDMLIGAENYLPILSVGQIRLGKKLPTLQNTVFGWIVSGRVADSGAHTFSCGICSNDQSELQEKVQEFWKLDEVESGSNLTQQEKRCEEHFTANTTRGRDGRFVVKLPFMKDPTLLGDSKETAYKRFLALERNLNKNESLKQEYTDFMKEYRHLGHMEEVDMQQLPSPHYFLPHHCVIRPDSTTTKLRVVFDASAKTSTNISLNEILHTGPFLQDDVFTVLLRFRLPMIVFTADIEKMYRQIRVKEEDKKFQLIFWRDHSNQPVKCYQLTTVTYGITTAPYLAIRCLRQIATQAETSNPLGSQAIKNNIYIDDVMAGANSLSEALAVQRQLKELLQSGGFKLRKWCANHSQLLQGIVSQDQAVQFNVNSKDSYHVKTLGIIWLPQEDNFCVKTIQSSDGKVTKRTVSSDIAHLFDPLGVMSPVVTKAKIFLQALWNLKIDWDEAVPMEMHSFWVKFREELQCLEDIKFPRHVFSGKNPRSIELHAFSDASEKAYRAAIYVRSHQNDGTVVVRLLCAKSKVAPIKATSIPRLELQAAALTTKLATRVKKELQWTEVPCIFWTDSEIVLAWLRKPSSSYVTFVANRVAAIQELTMVEQWRHVPSKENPADLVSRGISPIKLKDNIFWFYGPMFLHGSESVWPKNSRFETDLEMKPVKVALSVANEGDILSMIDHRNSFQHLQRVFAYVLRFVNSTRSREPKRYSHLTVEELEAATTQLIREAQRRNFSQELASLERSAMIDKQSNLSSLAPFLDKNGIIRVGGRLEKANIAYDAKHPMLLPYNDTITRLVMTDIHIKNFHVGPQGLLATTRQKFWPIKGKTIARSIVLNCVHCSKAKPKLLSQMMGNLPERRIKPDKPFGTTGVDFCGPFWSHYKIRGKKPQKCYVAVFVCFATKAVHLEVVSDLTTNAFIGALKRFVGRRGNCQHLYCDNATNFVGARNQLEELRPAIYSKEAEEQINKFCTLRGTEFHFIPPRAPHFGGLWEAAVKSAKNLLPCSLNNNSLTYEELVTVIVQIEAILNSRPITPMSSDPNDLTALTPGHFLIGEPLTSTAESTADPQRVDLHQHWKRTLHLKNQFWQRWFKEYLTELQYRTKWKQQCQNAQPGMMVIIKDSNVPAMHWPLGRILETIKGNDGLVRVAIVKTATGVLKRAIHNLAPQPVKVNAGANDEINEDNVTSTASSQSPSQTEGPPSSKKPRRSQLPISLLLLTCLVLPALGNNKVTITPFKSSPGLYFERMGFTHVSTDEWDLVIYYNMTNYWKELATINKGIENLDHLCSRIVKKHSCEPTLAQFTNTVIELTENNELLRQQGHRRWKRSPLNIFGNIAHSLFGILDDEYAEKMLETINHLEKNDGYLLELLRNQTSIIDCTTNIMKESHKAIEKRVNELEEYLNQTINTIKGINHEFHQEKISEYFNTLAIRLILMIAHYQRAQSTLLDVITGAHHGKVNPQVLTPRQLRDQIIVIKEHLPTTLRVPGGQGHLAKLYKIMSIEGRMLTEQMLFRIKLPLLSQERFETLRIVSVPIIANETFRTIFPSTPILLVNLHRDQYYPMSELEISKCLPVDHFEFICKLRHPLYRRGSRINDCEMAILTESGNLTYCEAVNTQQPARWTQLLNPNHWIYVTNQSVNINIICGSTISTRVLFGSGIINVTTGCSIKDEVTTLQTSKVHPTMIRTSIIPSRNLSNLIESTVNFNTTRGSIMHEDSLERDVKILQQSINQLRGAETELPTSKSTHVHHFTIGYLALTISLISLLYLVWKFYRRQPKPDNHPIPAPRKPNAKEFQVNPENPSLKRTDSKSKLKTQTTVTSNKKPSTLSKPNSKIKEEPEKVPKKPPLQGIPKQQPAVVKRQPVKASTKLSNTTMSRTSTNSKPLPLRAKHNIITPTPVKTQPLPVSKNNVMNSIHNVTVSSPPPVKREISQTPEAANLRERTKTRTLQPDEIVILKNKTSTEPKKSKTYVAEEEKVKPHDLSNLNPPQSLSKEPVAFEVLFDESSNSSKSKPKTIVKTNSSADVENFVRKTVMNAVQSTSKIQSKEEVNLNVNNPSDFPKKSVNNQAETTDNDSDEPDYEDDFESYESDFETGSSTASSPGQESHTAETSSEAFSEPEESSEASEETQLPVTVIHKEDERKLDSGSYEINSRRLFLQHQQQQLDSLDTSTVNSDQLDSGISYSAPNSSSNRTIFEPPPIPKRQTKISKRGQELMAKIQLDDITVVLFDLRPIQYEYYMKLYGNYNSSQMSTQTNDDRSETSSQTDALILRSIWTQHPPQFDSKFIQENDIHNLKNACGEFGSDFNNDVSAADHLSRSLSAMTRYHSGRVKPRVRTSQSDYVQLKDFLQRSEFTLASILNKPTVRKNLQTSSIPVTQGYYKLNSRFLSATKVIKIFSNSKSNLLLVIHDDVESVYSGDFRNLLSVWNINEPKHPFKLLSTWSKICKAEVCAEMQDVVVAGLEDGSIALWDLKEPYSFGVQFGDGSCYFPPTQTITPCLGLDELVLNDIGIVIDIKAFRSSLQLSKLQVYRPIQFASLNDSGIIAIWTLVNLEDTKGTSFRPNKIEKNSKMEYNSPSARFKLIQSAIYSLREYLNQKPKRPRSSFEKTRSYFENDLFSDSALKELQETNGKPEPDLTGIRFTGFDVGIERIYVSTNRDFILSCTKTLKTEKFRKIIFDSSKGLFATALKLLWSEDYLIVGFSNGSVIAYNCNQRNPQIQDINTSSNESVCPTPYVEPSRYSAPDVGKSCAIQNLVRSERMSFDDRPDSSFSSRPTTAFNSEHTTCSNQIFDKQVLLSGTVLRKDLVNKIEITNDGSKLLALMDGSLRIYDFGTNSEICSDTAESIKDIGLTKETFGRQTLALLSKDEDVQVHILK